MQSCLHRLFMYKRPVDIRFRNPQTLKCMELEMGFPPVATLADKQSTGLFGPTDKLRCNFLPISNPISVKQKATRVELELPLAWSWKWDFRPWRP